MRLHSHDPRDRKKAWRDRSEDYQCLIIQGLQESSFDSNPAQLEVLIIEKAADPSPRATAKHTRGFLTDTHKKQNIIVVLELLLHCCRKEQVLVQRNIATQKENTPKPGDEKRDEEDDRQKADNITNTNMPPCCQGKTKEKALFNEKLSSAWMKNVRFPVGYRDKKI